MASHILRHERPSPQLSLAWAVCSCPPETPAPDILLAYSPPSSDCSANVKGLERSFQTKEQLPPSPPLPLPGFCPGFPLPYSPPRCPHHLLYWSYIVMYLIISYCLPPPFPTRPQLLRHRFYCCSLQDHTCACARGLIPACQILCLPETHRSLCWEPSLLHRPSRSPREQQKPVAHGGWWRGG